MEQIDQKMIAKSVSDISQRKPKELSESLIREISCTRNRYGDASHFLTTLNPSVQLLVARNIERAYMGNSPSLSVIGHTYSPLIAETWVMAQIENLNDFCGTATKMNIMQMEELAKIILVDVYYLKASELMLFFHRFKAGKYGDLYGSVDPQKILSGLNRFLRDRMDELSIFQRKEQQRKREEAYEQASTTAITYDEYLRIKELETKQNSKTK